MYYLAAKFIEKDVTSIMWIIFSHLTEIYCQTLDFFERLKTSQDRSTINTQSFVKDPQKVFEQNSFFNRIISFVISYSRPFLHEAFNLCDICICYTIQVA